MAAMLPGAVAGALTIAGLGASSAAFTTFAPALNSVARPLLLLSSALLAVSGLRCSRAAVTFAATGGLLLYLAMYVFTRTDGATSPALFYPGLGLFAGAYVVGWRRRRASSCRPVVSPVLAGRLLAGTLLVGVVAVTVAAASAGPTATMGRHPGTRMQDHRPPDDSVPSGNPMPGMSK